VTPEAEQPSVLVVPARDEERALEAATRSKCLQDDPAP
jgi:hypothetical protein